MDTNCDAHLLDQHSMPQEDVGTSRPMSEASEDALSEAPMAQAAAAYVPGLPAETTEETTGYVDDQGHEPQVPGEPAKEDLPGEPAKWPSFHATPGLYYQGKGVPLTMHPEARPSSLVPAVGQEIALLGPEEGELLRKRRVAERRRIFAQRGCRGPDDSPFGEHYFDPSLDYRRVEWGKPVPQEEWERRVYVELNLATDLRYEGKAARPECHACRRRGSREVPLAKCVCCESWACERHLFVPACLEKVYAMCSVHPELEVRPHTNFSVTGKTVGYQQRIV
eukprot:5413560-Amphidinium_carterae.1